MQLFRKKLAKRLFRQKLAALMINQFLQDLHHQILQGMEKAQLTS
jgi:hypothetical protein